MGDNTRVQKATLWIPCVFGVILFAQASKLGLSDDEAYYWVLAQHPAWAYAFHPPAVAWFITFFQKLCSSWWPFSPAGLVRLPAVLTMSTLLGMSLSWLRSLGLNSPLRSTFILLSFWGLFSLGWMMVPDIPLFLGWMILFVGTWNICFQKKITKKEWAFLFAGSLLLILSKYSGVISVGTAFLGLFFWAPPSRKWKSLAIVSVGALFAVIPILIWNAHHEWGSILYQISDRHAGEVISWKRYIRFWGIESLLAGPGVVLFCFSVFWKSVRQSGVEKRVYQYCGLWIAPVFLVFCVQPFFSDFKPHWAFIVWWPTFLALAFSAGRQFPLWLKVQTTYGMTMGVLLLICCQLPILSIFFSQNPTLDVTNDFYGWPNLAAQMKAELPIEIQQLPIVGSRYQTAGQAAFSLAGFSSVTFLPRGIKEKDEWPDLNVSEHLGPQWPRLTHDVLFVADNRYADGPHFEHANCNILKKWETRRFGYLAKRIDLWLCRAQLN